MMNVFAVSVEVPKQELEIDRYQVNGGKVGVGNFCAAALRL